MASPLKTGGGDSALLNAAILNCEKRVENNSEKKRETEAETGGGDRENQGTPEVGEAKWGALGYQYPSTHIIFSVFMRHLKSYRAVVKLTKNKVTVTYEASDIVRLLLSFWRNNHKKEYHSHL